MKTEYNKGLHDGLELAIETIKQNDYEGTMDILEKYIRALREEIEGANE